MDVLSGERRCDYCFGPIGDVVYGQMDAGYACCSPDCLDQIAKTEVFETKDTNPKDSVGVRKVPFSTVPSEVIARLGLAMMEGALKYGRHNYRAVGVRASVYYDALMRHVTAWWEGENVDPESGENHLIKAMACLAVLFDSCHIGNWTDDRPPKLKDGWQKELNETAGKLIDKYPEPKQAYTEAK